MRGSSRQGLDWGSSDGPFSPNRSVSLYGEPEHQPQQLQGGAGEALWGPRGGQQLHQRFPELVPFPTGKRLLPSVLLNPPQQSPRRGRGRQLCQRARVKLARGTSAHSAAAGRASRLPGYLYCPTLAGGWQQVRGPRELTERTLQRGEAGGTFPAQASREAAG